MTRVRLRFPPGLAVTAGGMFILTLVAPAGSASAQVFFLQGEQGPPGPQGEQGPPGPQGEQGPPGDSALVCDGDLCSLSRALDIEGNLRVGGELAVTGAASFDAADVARLTVRSGLWTPECPEGYERDWTRDDVVLCFRGLDEMVKVGDFWVDRYESSVWTNDDCTGEQIGADGDWSGVDGSFPHHGSFSEPLYACSVEGVFPSHNMTWFQAVAACAASGKHLLTNEEWQMAVAGTVDPGPSDAAVGPCLTAGTGPRATGLAGDTPGGADSCISYWGVEDMIGNYFEWVAGWHGLGSGNGSQPLEFFSDLFLRVAPADLQGDYAPHFPAVADRGGSWATGRGAGAFALTMTQGPAARHDRTTFRCARTF